MLWLPTNLLLRLRKRALVRTDTVQCIIEDLKLFKKSLIHSSRHIIINTDGEEEDNFFYLEWSGVTGSLTSATTASNFDPELSSSGVQSVSSFWCHARCIVGKTWVFPNKIILKMGKNE